MDEGFLYPRHPRFKLSKTGYDKLCDLVDKRDGRRCIICNSDYGIHHHHVVRRTHGGADREDNLVLLCYKCHDIYAHGKKEKSYRSMFLEYLDSEKCRKFRRKHKAELDEIYTAYEEGKK